MSDPAWVSIVSDNGLITYREVLSWIGCTKPGLRKLIDEGFPKPMTGVRFNGSFCYSTRWRMGDIRKWKGLETIAPSHGYPPTLKFNAMGMKGSCRSSKKTRAEAPAPKPYGTCLDCGKPLTHRRARRCKPCSLAHVAAIKKARYVPSPMRYIQCAECGVAVANPNKVTERCPPCAKERTALLIKASSLLG